MEQFKETLPNVKDGLVVKVVVIDNLGKTNYVSLPISELADHFDVLPDSNMAHRTTAAIFRDLKIFTHIPQVEEEVFFEQEHDDVAGCPK